MDHTTTQIYNSKRRDPSSGKPHFCGDTLVSLYYIKILFHLQRIWVYFVSMSTERVFAWIIKASLQNLFYYAIVLHIIYNMIIYTYLYIKNIRNRCIRGEIKLVQLASKWDMPAKRLHYHCPSRNWIIFYCSVRYFTYKI